jgi:hypothetical protein
MAGCTKILSVNVHSLKIQRGPPPPDTEGEAQGDELAGV